MIARIANANDLTNFSSLWSEYLIESEKDGNDIIACGDNLTVLMRVMLGITGGAEGAAVIALEAGEPAGALLWSSPALPLRVHTKKALGLGTYVRPEFRGRGASNMMSLLAKSILHEQGFVAVEGVVVNGNEAGGARWASLGGDTVGVVVSLEV